jgi:hypothetical protein
VLIPRLVLVDLEIADFVHHHERAAQQQRIAQRDPAGIIVMLLSQFASKAVTDTSGDTPIVQFYRGVGTDARGRTLEAILGWDDEQLEAVHDYIQWLFPLDEPSRFNRDSPLLTNADRLAFRKPPLAANLRRALDRMLAFYGLAIDRASGAPRIIRSDRWHERSPHWLQPGNHNLLRLTRMIRSLALLGQADLATALYGALRRECEGRVSAVTLEYWKEAIDADA